MATLSAAAPTGTEWVHELKFDGYRIQAHVAAGRVKLFTRSGLDWTDRFRSIADRLARRKLPPCILDGEIVVEDEAGRSDFSALQQALSDGDDARFVFFAFDLLWLDGRDLRAEPLRSRKAALSGLLKGTSRGALRFSDHVEGSGAAMAKHACRLGLEGIVCKRADAPYRSGRVGDWVKVKCTARQELVIVGYVMSESAPGAIGSLVMGLKERGRMVHVGRVGTGYTAALARSLYRRLVPLGVDKVPVADVSRPAARGVHWVKPRLIAEVEMQGWSSDGMLRHASFKGLRGDKGAHEVVRERA